MDNSQFVLLELLKSSLFGVSPDFPADADWEAVYKEASAQTVVALTEPAVPRDKSIIWQEQALKSKAHYMRCLFEQTNLVKLLNENNIPFVIIKGAAAAMYYPKPILRTMGDIDFLVCEENFSFTEELLKNNGYEYIGDYGDGRDYTYAKGEVIFELHRRYSDSHLDIEDILKSNIKSAQIHELNGNKFPCFSDEINGLILLDHIRHHIYGGLGIRQITDYMMYLIWQTENGGLDGFLELVRKVNLEKFCGIVTKMCILFLGLPDKYEWCMNSDSDTANQLFNSLLEKGNFGRKDPYVYKPMNTLAQNIKEVGLFRFLQNAGITNWRAAQKHKFLKPFAFIYQIFRFIGKGISALFHGENLKKDFNEGNKISEFYDKLGI